MVSSLLSKDVSPCAEKIQVYHSFLFEPWLRTAYLAEVHHCQTESELERKLAYFGKAGQPFKTCGFTTGVLIRDSRQHQYYTAILGHNLDVGKMTYRAAQSFCADYHDGHWRLPSSLLMHCIQQRLTPGLTSLRKIPEPFHTLSEEALIPDPDAYWTEMIPEGPGWQRWLQSIFMSVRSDSKLIRPIRLLQIKQCYNETKTEPR